MQAIKHLRNILIKKHDFVNIVKNIYVKEYDDTQKMLLNLKIKIKNKNMSFYS